MTNSQDPASVVDRQLTAYNNKDIDAFMATWSDDATYYAYPDTLLVTGAAGIRERHEARFAEGVLVGTLIKRIVVGSTVIDYETVKRLYDNGLGESDVVAIYTVKDSLIVDARFAFGEVRYD